MAVTLEDLGKAARQGVATTVGLGLLILQHAQVQRRDLMERSGKLLKTVGAVLEDKANSAD
ncbi:MAG TPA: hypothetical protein VGJ86_19845 [Acidimicrobiales bacterium]|jgi:hypothetical protein